jgi:CRISPR/Cas system CSM-associated protein Csm3 (group 7 of RAMP superfamily)
MRTIALIRVDVEFDTAGGVTAPELDEAVDLPLRREGRCVCAGPCQCAVWLPPTSLAGSLRAHFGHRADQFFGSPPPTGKGADTALQPSPVRFLGTATTLPAGASLEVRASTAIDPRRGAAARSTLRTRELLPAGTNVILFLRYDHRDDSAQVPTYDLVGFIDTVATWQPWIGSGRSTGTGQAHVTRVAARQLDLTKPDQLLTWLRGDRATLFPPGADGWTHLRAGRPPQRKPVLAMDFVTVDALHIGTGVPGTAAAPAPIARTARRQPMIPGSAWKGVLRSRCGYILRSCGITACLVPAPDEAACRTCLLCDVFGWTGDTDGTAGQSVGHAGHLTFHDSTVDGTLGHRNHIGIDRFTGGARNHLLFADEIITDARFTLTITTRNGAELQPAVRGLLLLAVRDLDDGLTGIGRATTRGYGTIRLADTSRAYLDELDPCHEVGAAVRRLLTQGAAA